VLGIDWIQWRALVLAAFRIDLRTSGGALRRRSDASPLVIIGMQALFHGVVGLAFAATVYRTTDLLLGGTIFLTYVSFAVLFSVVVDYHTVVTSTNDYGVLGFRPISSRTYFAARMTMLLALTALITLALGAAPVVAYAARGGAALATAAIAAIGGTAITTAFAGIVLYGWLITHVSARRVGRTLSYVQLVLSMATYASFALVPMLLEHRGTIDMALPRTAWLHLHPAIWFARYLELADGLHGMEQVIPAAATVVLLGGLIVFSERRLSLDFAGRLAELSVASAGTRRTARVMSRRSWLTTDESRAIAVLVRAQFRDDQRFRLAVLAILPITIFYLIMTLRDQSLADPFSVRADQPLALYYGVLLFPVMLHLSLTRSDSHQAAWIFYASPTSPSKIVRAMKRYLLTRVIVPYLAVLSLFFGWFFDTWWHVVVHSAVLLLFAHAMLTVAVLLDPELPFARPIKQSDRSARMMVAFVSASAIAFIAMPIVGWFFYRSSGRVVVLFLGLLALNLALDLILHVRLQRGADRVEFAG
jgi:hypothetical protein